MPPNKIIPSTNFAKLYQLKMGGSNHVMKKIDSLIDQLRLAKDPRSLGEMKKGKLNGLYSLRVNKESRILYRVIDDNGNKTVELLRVCSHKNAYGKG